MPDQTKVYDSPNGPAADGVHTKTVKVFEEKKKSMMWLWWLLIPILLLIGFLLWYFTRTSDTTNRAPVTQSNMGAVYFALGSAALTDSDQQALNGAAAQMKQNSDMRLEIKGYTDSTGDQATNVALSNQRADVVKQYLGAQGVSDSRLDVKGFGQAPTADNGSGPDQGNRRVELTRE